jgi:hypothetical protein
VSASRGILEVDGAPTAPSGRPDLGLDPPRGDGRKDQTVLSESADRLCRMILSTDWPDVDVSIARSNLRELAEALFPDRMELYDMIYESRFDRLWEQFRDAGSSDEVD